MDKQLEQEWEAIGGSLVANGGLPWLKWRMSALCNVWLRLREVVDGKHGPYGQVTIERHNSEGSLVGIVGSGEEAQAIELAVGDEANLDLSAVRLRGITKKHAGRLLAIRWRGVAKTPSGQDMHDLRVQLIPESHDGDADAPTPCPR